MSTVASSGWRDLVADKKRRQQASIPKDWIITPPPEDVLDVTAVPAECGLLTERELEITDTIDVDTLLTKLAHGEWTSVEVGNPLIYDAEKPNDVVR
jgi:amidase